VQFRIIFLIGKSIMNKTFARLGLVSLLSTTGAAFAAVPAEVTTAIGDMKTDALVVAGAVLVAIIAVAAIKFIRKGL
jgi:H2-forming N5,N10-methylenetetrahydromethanopterin dehydrogenase-like enzyme